jgi:CHASE2 domain-containing sensor protein
VKNQWGAITVGDGGLVFWFTLRIRPRLTPIVASLLAFQVGLAAVVHFVLGQVDAIVPPLLLLVLCGIVAYGRFNKSPILARLQ